MVKNLGFHGWGLEFESLDIMLVHDPIIATYVEISYSIDTHTQTGTMALCMGGQGTHHRGVLQILCKVRIIVKYFGTKVNEINNVFLFSPGR